jgi:hypothetical protein
LNSSNHRYEKKKLEKLKEFMVLPNDITQSIAFANSNIFPNDDELLVLISSVFLSSSPDFILPDFISFWSFVIE